MEKKKNIVKGIKEELENISETFQSYFDFEDKKPKEKVIKKETVFKCSQNINNKEIIKPNNLETELQVIAVLKKFNEALMNKDIDVVNINNLSEGAKIRAIKDLIELSAKRQEKIALAEAKKKIDLQNKLNKFKEFLGEDLTEEEEAFIIENIREEE